MNAANIRHLYAYHFAINRKIWDQCIAKLDEAQFTQEVGYSHGSVRNQVVHIMAADQRWFSGLRQVVVPEFGDPAQYASRETVRQRWDAVEKGMRAYLAGLEDGDLSQQFTEEIAIWQVLIHVLNHGTDHRAQLLALLDLLGAPTVPQDYIYFVLGRM